MDNKFWKAAFIRAIRTVAQTALSMLTVNGVAVGYVNWGVVFGASFTAGVLSILTSIVTGLPEEQEDE